MNARDSLTKQESQVLALVAQGRRNAEIAQELYLSIRTVESHLYRIFQKLNVSSRTEAAIYAFTLVCWRNQNSVEALKTKRITITTLTGLYPF
jgi:DNA-binding NarL/FixJ family response regulator